MNYNPKKSPDNLAYEADLARGALNGLEKQYVAYQDGVRLPDVVAPTTEGVLEQLADNPRSATIRQVGVERVVRMGEPKRVIKS